MTTENNPADDSPSTKQVYEVLDDDELSLEEKQRRVLAIGGEYLGVTNGHIQRHPSDSTTDEILVSIGEDSNFLPEKTTVAHDKTYCYHTVQEPSPVAISNAPEQGWQNDPAYKAHESDCYLGTTLFVGGEVYGTVCFMQRTPREDGFTTDELLFIELLARLLGRAIEATQLEQRTEEKEDLQEELEKTTSGTLQLASELEEQYQSLFETAAEGIYTATDGLDEYGMANQAFADLLGFESGEELCAAVDSIEEVFVDPDQYAAYSETLQAEGELDRFEYQLRTTDGETRWVSDSVTAITDEEGAIDGYRGGVIDITDQKQQERDLKRQTNLSIVLNRVLRHNLRNDISVIRGSTQLMADKLDDGSNGQRALDAIDDLIDLSEKARKLDEVVASDAEPQPTDITDVINGVITRLRQEYSSGSISVEADKEITADVLPSFERAIQELVENTFKHGGDAPTVEVTVELGSDSVEIRLTDDGPGIDDMEADVLQSGTETPLMHGSGIGLWLTHWIVSENGGSIDVTGTEAGTTVTVTLPTTTLSGDEQQLSDIVRAQDQYKAAFEESGDGMTITDDDARILDVNDEAARIYGLNRQELLGRSMQEFLPDEFDFEAEWGKIVAGEIKRDEMPIVSADGGVSPISYTAKNHIVSGQHLIVSRDITERKEREQELQTITQRLQFALNGTNTGVWEWDIGSDDIVWTESMERLFGLDPGTFEGTFAAFKKRVHPDDRQQVENVVQASLETGETFQLEYRIHRDNGKQRWVKAGGELYEDGGTKRMVGILTDITDRKEREQELKRAEMVFQNTQDALFLIDVGDDNEFRIGRVNASYEAKTGLASAELTGKTPQEAVGDEVGSEIESRYRECVERRETLRYVEEIPFDGKSTFWETKLSPLIEDGSVTQLIGATQDITERREREQELSRINERYETLLQAAPDPVFVAEGETGKIIEVNDAAETLLGMSGDEIIGLHQSDLHPSNQPDIYRQLFEEHVESGGTRRQLPDGSPIQIVTADGDRVPVEISVDTVSLPDGPVTYGIFREISDRVEDEGEIAEKRRERRAIIQNIPESIYIKDSDGYYQFINESGAELFGNAPEEIIDKHDEDLYDAESVADIRADDTQVMESGKGMNKETVRFINGEKYVFLDDKFPYRDEDGEIIGLMGISSDISEHKQYVRELERQNEQLDDFASVVSHDLRNPLNVAQGRLQLVREEYESEHLNAIENAHERMETLIDELLALARAGQTVDDLDPISLGTISGECWRNVNTKEGAISIATDSTIQANASQLQQLLENLFRNAVEHGGEDVIVTIGDVESEYGFYVEDDGSGVPDGDRDQLFEPGFTTQQGAGLGLNIVEQIAGVHGWEVAVVSGNESGTRFEFTGVEYSDGSHSSATNADPEHDTESGDTNE